ncbi:ester cyclase [Vibrio sp. SS-MA-C1-2]|uniref:ester cyclase n=1 Tax=Vibrio sp. SS-MA-C1-2 TaxID=2908646 RepID=UPI001F15AB1A|nr:ester cyclase [Vibrio sp. SS-MA-C1-2]UJF17928.1 ester cyclase [Vibrio sp. SS-MA-C1-2]
MSMTGFDPKWKDFPDYIIGITKEIWEDRGLHTLHQYYAKDIVVRTPQSISIGNQGVINNTMEVLAKFPDRTLYGEDVIWSGNPEDGMLSSHRIISTATDVETGKKLKFRIIADCHAKNNQIDDEWLIRDQGAIARQLGYTPAEYSMKLIEDEGGIEKSSPVFLPAQDVEGPYPGKGNDNQFGQKYAEILESIMAANLTIIPKEYDRACIGEYAGGQSALSYSEVDQFWVNLRSAFPNAVFKIEHQIGLEGDNMSPRAAIRWSLEGKHEGFGAFGKPTGANVYIMGACHAEFGPWGIRREFAFYDEIAIWKQIQQFVAKKNSVTDNKNNQSESQKAA